MHTQSRSNVKCSRALFLNSIRQLYFANVVLVRIRLFLHQLWLSQKPHTLSIKQTTHPHIKASLFSPHALPLSLSLSICLILSLTHKHCFNGKSLDECFVVNSSCWWDLNLWFPGNPQSNVHSISLNGSSYLCRCCVAFNIYCCSFSGTLTSFDISAFKALVEKIHSHVVMLVSLSEEYSNPRMTGELWEWESFSSCFIFGIISSKNTEKMDHCFHKNNKQHSWCFISSKSLYYNDFCRIMWHWVIANEN